MTAVAGLALASAAAWHWRGRLQDVVGEHFAAPGEVVIRARLLEQPRIPGKAAAGTPLLLTPGPEANWLVSLRIEGTIAGQSPLPPGSTQRLLVHSPTFFFFGAVVPGRVYRFRVSVDHTRVTGIEPSCCAQSYLF